MLEAWIHPSSAVLIYLLTVIEYHCTSADELVATVTFAAKPTTRTTSESVNDESRQASDGTQFPWQPPSEPLHVTVTDSFKTCSLDWDPPLGYEHHQLSYTIHFTVRHLQAFGVIASPRIYKTGNITVSQPFYSTRKSSLLPFSLYEFIITANSMEGEGPPCNCPQLQCKTPQRQEELNEWSQSSIATFSFLCSALFGGGCLMPAAVMYCRKRQQMKSSTQQRDEQEEESGESNHFSYI